VLLEKDGEDHLNR